jgi:hypothetical protein
VLLAFADCARLEQNGIHVQGPRGESDSQCTPALASDRFQALILRMAARDYTTTPPQPLVCPSCNKVGIVDVSTADNPYAKSDDFRVERLPEGFAVRRLSKGQFETQFECTTCNVLVPRHSDYDWLILSQSRMGMSSGATRIWMLRATPGWRR